MRTQTIYPSYLSKKASISLEVDSLRRETPSLEDLSESFKTNLVDEIIPHWYGTQWSFEGHTNTPQKGEIACGYFVSTSLKHLGLNINRYLLAQQNPLNEAKTLALGGEVFTINYDGHLDLKEQIVAQLTDGLYFIGFDHFHVGFMLIENCEVFIIHSNFMGDNGVEKEELESSAVISMCSKVYLVNLDKNRNLLQAWINGEEVVVKKGK